MFRNTAHYAFAALALVALPLAAQRPGGGGPPAGVTPGQGAPDPAMRHEFLAGYLSLSAAQRSQAESIFAQMGAASETLRGQMQAAQENLQAAVKASRTDAEIDRLAGIVGTLEGQGLALRSKAMAKFNAILTAEQKTKLEQLEGMRGGFGGRPGGGRPGGRP